ncbi:hypothetical protein [Planococcus lenghuensis]|uniref:hypothetical protein n=1 Tax=Planococcus lenghuensis TaxID=2213202 RepID=UPI001E380D28|nr:hypothetical protein [Planococcus lenghuensis]
MRPPEEILTAWNQFSDFPMETLTKAWYFAKSGEVKQRPVALMKEHQAQFGASGNCFDLAIWLLDEFQKAGVEAYSIGDGSGRGPDARRRHCAR